MNINGELKTDVLQGVSIIAYDYNGTDWGALGRHTRGQANKPFTEYRTDEWGEFKIVGRHAGSAPTVIKQFQKTFMGLMDKKIIYRKGMTRKEWEDARK